MSRSSPGVREPHEPAGVELQEVGGSPGVAIRGVCHGIRPISGAKSRQRTTCGRPAKRFSVSSM